MILICNVVKINSNLLPISSLTKFIGLENIWNWNLTPHIPKNVVLINGGIMG